MQVTFSEITSTSDALYNHYTIDPRNGDSNLGPTLRPLPDFWTLSFLSTPYSVSYSRSTLYIAIVIGIYILFVRCIFAPPVSYGYNVTDYVNAIGTLWLPCQPPAEDTLRKQTESSNGGLHLNHLHNI